MELKLANVDQCQGNWASSVSQMVKNLPAMQETQVQSLDLENPLEKRMALSILPIPMEWIPIPVFLPGEFHGQSLASYSP